MKRVGVVIAFMLLSVICMPKVLAGELFTMSHDVVYTASRKIVLPDGTPAAGATVTILTNHPGAGLQRILTTTDANGIFTARVRKSVSHGLHTGFMLVALPHYALCLGRLTEASGQRYSEPGFTGTYGPLTLQPAFQQEGLVVDDATGTPVPNATVMVIALNNFVVNVPSQGITTPSFSATTDAAGKFSMSGATVEPGMILAGMSGDGPQLAAPGGARAAVVVVAKTGETVLGGESLHFVLSPTPAAMPQTLHMEKAISIEGKVLNSITHAPIVGAKVSLTGKRNLWMSGLPEISTDANGAYRVFLLAGGAVFITVTHPDFCSGWGADPCPTITMDPLMTVTGNIIDVATGQAPVAPIRLNLIARKATFFDAFGWIGGLTLSGTTGEGGAYTMRVPSSGGAVELYGPGYEGSGMLAAKSAGPVTLQATRRAGILIRCTTASPDGFSRDILWYKDATGQARPMFDDPYFFDTGFMFLDAKRVPGDQVSISVKRNGVDVLPWTTVEKGIWPNLVALP